MSLETGLFGFVMFLAGTAAGGLWILLDRERWHRSGGQIAMESADEYEALARYILPFGTERWPLRQFLETRDGVFQLKKKLAWLQKCAPQMQPTRPDLLEAQEKIAAFLKRPEVEKVGRAQHREWLTTRPVLITQERRLAFGE